MLGKQHPISEDVFKTFAIKAGSVHTDYSRCFLASLFIWRWGAVIDQDPDQVLHLLQESNWRMWRFAWCFLSWVNKTAFFSVFSPRWLRLPAVPDFTWQHVSPRVSWSGVLLNASGSSPWLKRWSLLKCSFNLMIIYNSYHVHQIRSRMCGEAISLCLSLFLFKPKKHRWNFIP